VREEKPGARSQEPEWLRELPAEALENGRLREGIAERLERLQQAAHPRLANLLGMREVEGKYYLVWQKVDGQSLAEVRTELSEDDIYRALRELIDALEGLHQLGLVHGDLQTDNIIVSGDGIYLTNSSALLWTEEQMDVRAAEQMVRSILQERRLPGPTEGTKSLRELAAFLDGGYVPEFAASGGLEKNIDRRILAWAIVLVVLAGAVAGVIAWHFRSPVGKILQSSVAHCRPEYRARRQYVG
jgi:serine/threonine protein kinase